MAMLLAVTAVTAVVAACGGTEALGGDATAPQLDLDDTLADRATYPQ